MKNKKGLSDIIVTLLIILLVIVAISVIWVVIRNIVTSGVDKINYDSKCLEVDLVLTSFEGFSPGGYDITLKRTGTGDIISGFKILVKNATEFSEVTNQFFEMGPLEYLTLKPRNTGIWIANKIEVTPFFLDELNSERLCSTFSFEV